MGCVVDGDEWSVIDEWDDELSAVGVSAKHEVPVVFMHGNFHVRVMGKNNDWVIKGGIANGVDGGHDGLRFVIFGPQVTEADEFYRLIPDGDFSGFIEKHWNVTGFQEFLYGLSGWVAAILAGPESAVVIAEAGVGRHG